MIINDKVDFQRANGMVALLKHCHDGDAEEGTILPLSFFMAKEKIMSRMGDRYSRYKVISEEYERFGGRKGDNCGKVDFFNL